MTKHTPGPWVAKGKGGTSDGGSTKQHPCFNGEIKGSNGQAIIQQLTFIGLQGATPEEAEANAKLIEAAPTMLVALKDAFATMLRWSELELGLWDERDQLTFDQIQDAINKAEI